MIDLPNGTSISLLIDRALESECAWGVAGRQSLRGDVPGTWPEARVAAQSGKWPRRVGVHLSDGVRDWACSLQGDRFVVSGLRLPRPEVPAETPLHAESERIESIAAFDQNVIGLYDAFLGDRFGKSWQTIRGQIAEWIKVRSRRGARQETPQVKTKVKTPEEALATAS